MTKEEIIQIVESMGFRLDYDQWDLEGKGWMRFVLKEELDEKDLRLIWWKDAPDYGNFSRAAGILFKAGQKAKMKQLTEYLSL